ncbi:hypothetical protein GCM10010343_17140 [Streptomyces avidinii]|nr:hypothetical protein GCM10010343_17140 [Streptomyces avidinii]
MEPTVSSHVIDWVESDVLQLNSEFDTWRSSPRYASPSRGELNVHLPSPEAQSAMSSCRVGWSEADAGRAVAAATAQAATVMVNARAAWRLTRCVVIVEPLTCWGDR